MEISMLWRNRSETCPTQPRISDEGDRSGICGLNRNGILLRPPRPLGPPRRCRPGVRQTSKTISLLTAAAKPRAAIPLSNANPYPPISHLHTMAQHQQLSKQNGYSFHPNHTDVAPPDHMVWSLYRQGSSCKSQLAWHILSAGAEQITFAFVRGGESRGLAMGEGEERCMAAYNPWTPWMATSQTPWIRRYKPSMTTMFSYKNHSLHSITWSCRHVYRSHTVVCRFHAVLCRTHAVLCNCMQSHVGVASILFLPTFPYLTSLFVDRLCMHVNLLVFFSSVLVVLYKSPIFFYLVAKFLHLCLYNEALLHFFPFPCQIFPSDFTHILSATQHYFFTIIGTLTYMITTLISSAPYLAGTACNEVKKKIDSLRTNPHFSVSATKYEDLSFSFLPCSLSVKFYQPPVSLTLPFLIGGSTHDWKLPHWSVWVAEPICVFLGVKLKQITVEKVQKKKIIKPPQKGGLLNLT
ncbi:hypothetical protein VP01_2020g4 [Puccinia sorghi]|uniref:Uncharacterized protein n=1 Tax=Puccinia sorghi TaxID=27349 RepID=A0A0L6VB69_9BASI|nr:hypothetical protein VP01_2020g4 [Puccinia sorghi]